MSKQKIIEKEYFVELTMESNELILEAYRHATAAIEYYKHARNSDACKVETLICYLKAIEKGLGDVEYRVKSKSKLNFNPKEQVKNTLKKIPFEIRRKERKEA